MKKIIAVVMLALMAGCIKNPVEFQEPKECTCELPDLVITNVYVVTDLPYLYVQYKNIGKAEVKGKFAIHVIADYCEFKTAECFPGDNETLRPGEERTTGGLTIGMLGANKGERKEVYAGIDYTFKVKESNEANNTYFKSQLFKVTKTKDKQTLHKVLFNKH